MEIIIENYGNWTWHKQAMATANGSDRIYAAVKCNKRNLQDYDHHCALTYYALDTAGTGFWEFFFAISM